MRRRASRFSVLDMGRTMGLPRLAVARALVLGALLSSQACDRSQDASKEPPPKVISKAAQQTLDDRFAEVASRDPAFGGMYVDEKRQTLIVYSKDTRQQAIRTLKGALDVVLGPERIPPLRMEVLPAQYNFAELKEWQERATVNILRIPGVVLVDVDDKSNRLTVGVETLELRGAIEAELTKARIPRSAVNLEVTPAVKVETSLTDRHRPLVGGLQISFSGGICTQGFNAIRLGTAGFVTCSHCTATQGGVESTIFHQATMSGTTNRVGVETADPAYFEFGWPFALTRVRRSDAAFVQRDVGVDGNLGTIARPAAGGVAWNGVDVFRIVSAGDPLVGQTVTKVGRTTGLTQGVVNRTCANIAQSGTNIIELCQSQAGYASGGGDSGSPIFRVTNSPATNDVSLGGIHWGSGGTFSPLSSVERSSELGDLSVCAAGFCIPTPPRGHDCTASQKCCEPSEDGKCLLCYPKTINGRPVSCP
jgi:hypothetical protein